MELVLCIVICIGMVCLFPKRHLWVALLFSAILLGFLAFCLNAENQYDFVFHTEFYDALRGESFSAVRENYYYEEHPLYVLYVYALTFFGNHSMLPAVTTFIGYLSCFLVILIVQKKEKLEKSQYIPIFVFLLCCVPWHNFAAGIRGALSYSLCALALCIEHYSKSKLRYACFLVYILTPLIHQSAVVFLVIRLLSAVCSFFRKKRGGILAVACVFLLCFSVAFFADTWYSLCMTLYEATGISIIKTVAGSFYSYAIEGKELYEYGVVMTRIAHIIIILVVVFVLKFLRVEEYDCKQKEKSSVDVLNVFSLIALVVFGFITQYDIVCRFAVACVMISPLVFGKMRLVPIQVKYGSTSKIPYNFFVLFAAAFTLVYYTIIFYSKWVFTI